MTAETKRSLEQERAEHALRAIKELEKKGVGQYGHYVSYVSSLPATIVMNGLGQALATLLAKAGRKKDSRQDPNHFLYEHVASWLARQIDELEGNADGVIDRLMENDQQVYLRAQAEAMAYLHWLKQFARAYLQETEGRADD